MSNKNYYEKTNISDNYSRKLISGKVTSTAGIRNPDNLKLVYGLGANRIEVLRALEKHNKFRLIWYIIFFVLGIVCLILEPRSWFYVLDLYVLMVNIDLVSQGKLIGVYIGIAECFMYAYICFVSGLYGEVIKMFVINVPLNIFTLVSWTKNLKEQKKVSYKSNEEENAVTIRKLNKKSYIWVFLIAVVLFVACYFGLWALNTSALIFSTGVLVCTILNEIMNGMRYKESWLFSILANVISIGMWVQVIVVSSSSGLNLMELAPLVSTLASLVNSFYGYDMWKSMYRKVAVNGGEVLAKRKVKIKKIVKLRRKYQKLYWDKKIDMEKNS